MATNAIHALRLYVFYRLGRPLTNDFGNLRHRRNNVIQRLCRVLGEWNKILVVTQLFIMLYHTTFFTPSGSRFLTPPDLHAWGWNATKMVKV